MSTDASDIIFGTPLETDKIVDWDVNNQIKQRNKQKKEDFIS